ncbi:pyridoxamine 5'-phosphate oxidase family protein [Microvirga tunisiensis]|uniref:Pyridoxamine 5'-phosphate oxidase family protein n=2 Tax=Pannonibacter tanglangensis TaxID=2750084 RepID=A0A7X5J899_9HYPH|nr:MULTISPECIES: pyridoxamine 5'-phosphate oxidase family protein [unclassified Pannonibacter]NBN63360.1 pyridoxamine 5'-phosphate oxidase family protein [Pannonibacter sp. XCT-34]NBN76995.1 pyridoxamine 5'-phosphate oxidase family protein [Pannonibacter sp. XCT-53]
MTETLPSSPNEPHNTIRNDTAATGPASGETAPVDRKALPRYARVRNGRRADYDADAVHAILDAGLVGHVGFIHEDRPMVIPMAYGRDGSTLYIHGAGAARIVKALPAGAPVTLAVTLIDGLVVARAAFHNSVNYRSAIVHGRVRELGDTAEAERALALITDHLLPGRWAESRPMTEKELKATGIIAIEIEHAAAKCRAGGPVDDESDLGLPVWAGVVPVMTALGVPLADASTPVSVRQPASLAASRRKFL